MLAVLLLLLLSLLYWFFVRVPPSRSLGGRRILITGAAHGLGEELAIRAASRGATLVLWDVDGEALEAVVLRARDALRASGHAVGRNDTKAVVSRAFDIADEAALLEARDQALRGQGEIDSVVSNAAMLHGVSTASLSGAQVARSLSVNLGAAFSLVRTFTAHLKAGLLSDGEKRSRRTLCFVSSVMGAGLGAAGLSDYCATKAGLCAMVECLRQEVNNDRDMAGRLGVHLVCPWIIGDTEMFTGAYTSPSASCLQRCLLLALQPLKRGALADHILDGLAWYPGAHWVTFRPLVTRYLALVLKLVVSPSVGLYDAIVGAFGGSNGMQRWKGAPWNRVQCQASAAKSERPK